ncbi:hypothetical protein Mal4_45470 [Maioricimonas rarisocia]|uniref:Secreted protein n=1 Tax=Maioricimonas rarisocia TaxID=2528026 RepID=A0A517ZCK8_9PLAN|nr:hypothetical protein [Maioricimonas rarisocia]QDU40192.1 hypothetical protein Mal4_45470 [Maioricimonas rarisocia]
MHRILLTLTFASFLFLLHGCAGDADTATDPVDDTGEAVPTDLGEPELGEPASPEAMESGSATGTSELPPEQSEPEVPTPIEEEEVSQDGPILPEASN